MYSVKAQALFRRGPAGSHTLEVGRMTNRGNGRFYFLLVGSEPLMTPTSCDVIDGLEKDNKGTAIGDSHLFSSLCCARVLLRPTDGARLQAAAELVFEFGEKRVAGEGPPTARG